VPNSLEQGALGHEGGVGVLGEGAHARVVAEVDVDEQPDVDVGVGDGKGQSNEGLLLIAHEAAEHADADSVPHRREPRDDDWPRKAMRSALE